MKRPVVIIPGIFGSRLINQNNEILWPCSSKLTSYKIPGNMIRLWGMTDKDGYFNNFSDDIVSPILGLAGCEELIPGLEEFKCFYYISQQLQDIGYIENETLFAFTYDFRHSLVVLVKQFVDFIQNLNLTVKPILITHSIGSLIPKFTQYLYPNWDVFFSSQIAIAGTFDGGNGGGLMAVINGYDLQFSWLQFCTRGLWCNSGMELGLLQGKRQSGVNQFVYVKYNENKDQVKVNQQSNDKDVELFWNSCKVLQNDEKSTILGIFKKVLNNPSSVSVNAGYWAQRFAQFLGRKVKIPRTTYEESSTYYKARCCFNREWRFFASNQINSPLENFDVIQTQPINPKTTSEPSHYIRYAFWNERPPIVPTPEEIEFFSSNTLENAPQQQIVRLAYAKFQLDTNQHLPPHKETRDLRELYEKITPENSLEKLIFPQNNVQHDLHQELRDREIDFKSFKFASICGCGVKTSAHAVFGVEIQNEYELVNQKANEVFSEGDGTVLLVSQLGDQVDEKCVIERKVFSGVGHVDLMRKKECVDKIMEFVQLMQ